MKIVFQKKNAILCAIIGAVVFSLVPIVIHESINRFAPISYWVDIQSIIVSDIDIETLHQSVTINRVVRNEINGYPRQELQLVKVDDPDNELLTTAPSVSPVDFEKKENNTTLLPVNFWIKKGIEQELRNTLEIDTLYRWVWVIEFVRPNGETEIERYPTNTFQAR